MSLSRLRRTENTGGCRIRGSSSAILNAAITAGRSISRESASARRPTTSGTPVDATCSLKRAPRPCQASPAPIPAAAPQPGSATWWTSSSRAGRAKRAALSTRNSNASRTAGTGEPVVLAERPPENGPGAHRGGARRPTAQQGRTERSRALCAPRRCRAVRGNGDEAPSWQRAHTTTARTLAGTLFGTGAPEAFPDGRQS